MDIASCGLEAKPIQSQQSIQKLLTGGQEKVNLSGDLVLSLRFGSGNSSGGKFQWIHFVDITRSLGSDIGEPIPEVCRQQDIATAMLAAHMLGDTKVDKQDSGDSFLLRIAAVNHIKNPRMMIITHINASAAQCKNTCILLSLADRLAQEVCSGQRLQANSEGTHHEHLRNIAKLQLLRTKIQNSTLLASCAEPAGTKLLDDLFGRIVKINSGQCTPEQALTTSSEDAFKENRRFQGILQQIRILASKAAENGEKVERYSLQVKELSIEVENCQRRKEELKEALADYKKRTNGDAEKLGGYTEELQTMRRTVKELKATDAEKEERLKDFQVSPSFQTKFCSIK